MNVYQQNYKAEFINKLPVNFDKFKNMDLSEIPPVFHDLFTTDWNWGIYSKMPYKLRNIMNDLHTEYNNWQIFEKDKKVQEEVFLGGFSN